MTYTFLSARYANANETAAFAQTDGFGEVLVSQADAPDQWGDLLASGVAIGAYVPPPLPVPPFISDRQFAQHLAVRGLISEQEAEEWVGPGTVPAAMLALVDTLPASEQFSARMLLRGATRFERGHPLVEKIGSLSNPPWTTEQLNEFWREAAAL